MLRDLSSSEHQLLSVSKCIIKWSRLGPPNLRVRTIIFHLDLYGRGTWSLLLREELWLRVFDNRVLRRVLGPKRDEVTGEWRKLHNEEHNLNSSPNIVLVIKSR